MGRKIKLWEDPYGEGNLYTKKSVTIKPGLTVLVGCNGIGKTTFLNNIQEQLKKQDIPCIMFDNLNDGGSNARSNAAYHEDFSFVATSMQSSEGENIVLNIGRLASRLGYFVKNGIDYSTKNKFAEALKTIINNEEDDQKLIPNERWILLDAVDSGLSIDNIVEIKRDLFDTMLKFNFDNEIYIIVSANEYEMANGENCLDVYNMKYVKFKDYDEYRELILRSNKDKNRRYEDK